ncbi:class I SAM-dependent methyltransferase [Kiritimatiella glycovorans]|uniref:Class I SAM-dependent methyltransferase n=1 Tax=Kiritimatiella glycovorans TaxID=1307763 RepID=A0A0G3EH33_9BACT|nr:class I SAM-dependent methyltransferase [Kiritimatiella glycovorans]AKJ64120.1 hypothetical protein L21SP4_00857 [Kiritimatiella glycovorans]
MRKSELNETLPYLYEASVQGVDNDLDFAGRIYRRRHGRRPKRIREDFCGSALLASTWVRRRPANRAWGVDLHRPTLDWSRRHHVERLSRPEADRLELIEGDVRTARIPPVQVTFALNFSFCIFYTRDELREYFAAAREGLEDGGVLILDLYGGTEAVKEKEEPRAVDGFTTPEGVRVPPFTYVWDQDFYDVITHRCRNYIHFRIPGVGTIRRAHHYDWRLWTIPEVRELLAEAGFRSSEAYLHGWTDDGESDEVWRRRTSYENAEAWIAYLAGWR